MLSRRAFVGVAVAGLAGSLGLSSYAFAYEPRFRLDITSYRLRPPGWPEMKRPLRIAALADIHACEPWMPVARIGQIVETTNALKPDLIVLLGDYVSGLRHFITGTVQVADWCKCLSHLSAPLGVHAVLGNHDWWADVQRVRAGIRGNNIRLLENDAVFIEPANGPAFWLAGLDDQLAFGRRGADDLPATMAKIGSEHPVLMLAHEPDIFRRMPGRVSLTLSGHTHGGQVDLPLIGRPIIPSYTKRYDYGHIVEDGRNLIISGGLGCTGLPVRFGVPPEIVMVELG